MGQALRKSQPSPSASRRERERVEMTRRIMEVAREMFVQDGYDAVTLRRIADAIEYTPPAIYKYFKDKHALVDAIVQEDVQALAEMLLAHVHLTDPVERLKQLARGYAQWGVSHPNHYRLLFAAPEAWAREEESVRRESEAESQTEGLALFYAAIESAMEAGSFKEEFTNPSLVARTLWAGIHGVVMLEITLTEYDRSLLQERETLFEQSLETMIGLLIRGFLREGESAH